MSSRRPKSGDKKVSAREMWLKSVKNRQNSAGGLTGSSRFYTHMPKSDIHGYFSKNLRKNAVLAPTGTGSLDKKNLQPGEVPFLSTSDYLRQQFGAISNPVSSRHLDSKVPSGTPYYKTPEEYYDEVLELRKQISAFANENTILKSKQRRLEDEISKKDKELVQAFEKQLERGETESLSLKSDRSISVQNFKLRLFKLEQKYKAKDAACRRLEADIKTTNIEELRHQLDICLEQIASLRYHNARILSGHASDRSSDVPQLETGVRMMEVTSDSVNEETDSCTSDSETGYNRSRSRSHSRVRSASASRQSFQKTESGVKTPVPIPIEVPQRIDELSSTPEQPQCTIKEHKRLEEVEIEMKEMYDAFAELDKHRKDISDGKNGSVRVSQKVPLKGRPYERLLTLDRQETQLLQKVNDLTSENEEIKEKLRRMENTMSQMDSELKSQKDTAGTDAVLELQSVFRAHSSRLEDRERLKNRQDFDINFDEAEDESADEDIIALQSLVRAHSYRKTFYELNLGR